MIKKITEWFAVPTPEALAKKELQEAKRQLLQSQSACEYAAKLSQYHLARIQRLTQYLKEVA